MKYVRDLEKLYKAGDLLDEMIVPIHSRYL